MSNQEKIVAWEAKNEEIKIFLQQGAENYFKKEFPDLKRAFLSKLNCVVCMDEGTAHKDVGGEAKLCMAGSGMLFPAANEEERIKKVASLFNVLGIKDVTSHGSCGAAGLAYKRDYPKADPKIVTAEVLDNYAKDWSRKVKEEMNRLGSESENRHIAADDMERPADFHTARLVYFDGVGGFNPSIEIGLPMGFVISRHYVPQDYAAEELKVAVAIAFGHHGFENLFSQEWPLVVVVFAGNVDDLQNLKDEVTKILVNLEPYKEGKVKVDGMLIA